MKIILSSFGITHKSDLPQRHSSSPFYQMPPMRIINNVLMPDYAALLLSDKVIIDKQTFDALQDSLFSEFSHISNTIKLLFSEGYVEIVDYESILKENNALLKIMLENDINMLDQWVNVFKESLMCWRLFVQNFISFDGNKDSALFDNYSSTASMIHDLGAPELHNYMSMIDNFESRNADSGFKFRHFLTHIISNYLSHVNANILLANKLNAGLHDWVDFMPFYRNKFQSASKKGNELAKHNSEVHKLFNISFPEFSIRDPYTLVKAIQDKRVIELRNLVQDAVDGKVSFDESFARNVFKEVLGVERNISRYRNIISYITIPLDFLPWVGVIAPKVIEEIGGLVVEQNLRKQYRWFYLLSDLANEGF